MQLFFGFLSVASWKTRFERAVFSGLEVTRQTNPIKFEKFMSWLRAPLKSCFPHGPICFAVLSSVNILRSIFPDYWILSLAIFNWLMSPCDKRRNLFVASHPASPCVFTLCVFVHLNEKLSTVINTIQHVHRNKNKYECKKIHKDSSCEKISINFERKEEEKKLISTPHFLFIIIVGIRANLYAPQLILNFLKSIII